MFSLPERTSRPKTLSNRRVSRAANSRVTFLRDILILEIRPGIPKNIALFIDGTWNSAGDAGERTNVHKLYEAAAAQHGPIRKTKDIPIAESGSPQVAHYIKGVGTRGKINKYVGGVTGFGTAEKIREAYLLLALNYQLRDRVYIFGFSRGAFAARALAGFVGARCDSMDIVSIVALPYGRGRPPSELISSLGDRRTAHFAGTRVSTAARLRHHPRC